MVSIIIPLYNVATTLYETLNSIFIQDFTDWEIILFDDGSTDETPIIAKKIAAKYPNKIRYFQHSDCGNYGPGVTRNRAVEVAKGELLAFLDADDLWFSGKLREQVRWMKIYPNVAMVWGPAEYFGIGIKSYKQPTGLFTKCYEPPTLVKIFISNLRGTPCPSSIMVRRKHFLWVGGFEEKLRRGEDIAFCLKIAMHYPIIYDDRIWFRYRRHINSSTFRSKRESFKDKFELEFYQWLLEFVYTNVDLADLVMVRKKVENEYHIALQKWVSRSGYWVSRLKVTYGLAQFPKLFLRRLWCLVLDWIFPFRLSRKIVAKITFCINFLRNC